MNKIITLFFLFCYIANHAFSQNNLNKRTAADTSQVNSLLHQSKEIISNDPEKAIAIANQAKAIAEKINYREGLGFAYKTIGIANYMKGRNFDAIENYDHALAIFDSIGNKTVAANLLSNTGAIYFMIGNDGKALDYYFRALKLSEQAGDTTRTCTVLINIGSVYSNKKTTTDKAIFYYQRALTMAEKLNDEYTLGTVALNLGDIYMQKAVNDSALIYLMKSAKAYEGSENEVYSLIEISKAYTATNDLTSALTYARLACDTAKKNNVKLDMAQAWLAVSKIYEQQGDKKNAITYYTQAGLYAEDADAKTEIKNAYEGLANVYAGIGDYQNAFKYQQLVTIANDSINKMAVESKTAISDFDLNVQKKEGEKTLTREKKAREEQLRKEKKFRTGLFIGLGLVLIIASIQWWFSRQRKKANAILQLQKNETEQQKEKAEKALNELKATQAQLIQSEKMASLGELTAGIAHEIQNPLNFVNNFSEVSAELIKEMVDEVDKGNTTEVKAIAGDLVQNLEKINHHGKRADAIVKGMLQHSRSSSGTKAPTDINALCDEYLRLAYHGLRAKDKSFNATLKTDFDEAIGKINIIPQDIGRVILNLITNAFYAVNPPQPPPAGGGVAYVPTVSVSTKKVNGRIEVKVSDNGTGIPKNIIDKIFQPFFTTKPTGQGTGLGLSLAYDIVKAHGGELKVETKEAEGTIFIIQLPVV